MSTILIMLLGTVVTAVAADGRVINFRGEASGGYPDARPPTTFSATQNLAWKATVGQGCGAPLVVDERLYVQAAPNALVCLDKATGQELWRRTHHAGGLDATSPAVQMDALMDDVGAFHVAVQRARHAAKDAANRAELEAAAAQAEANLPKGAIAQLPGAGIGGYGNGGIYLIVMTPCSDGERVVAVFPTGLAVAYDLAGTRLWSADVRPSATPPKALDRRKWRPLPGVLSTCPVMTAEGIVVAVYGVRTVGLDARTGKVLWQTYGNGTSNASPVVGVVGGKSFVATGSGDILSARDGAVVYQGAGPYGTCSVTPVFAEGVFCWGPLAVKVVPGDPPKAEVAWALCRETMEDLAKRCYAWKYPTPHLSGSIDFTSPVVTDGRLLYYGWGQRLTVFDAATEKVIAQHAPQRSHVKPLSSGVTKNWAYGGMIRAGGHLIVIHDNGLVKFLPVNDTYSPIKACALPDDVYAQPACDGSALFIRSLNALWRFDDQTRPRRQP